MSQNNSILGTITQAEQQLMYKRLDNARATLNAYIKHYETKLKTMKGSGLTKKQKNKKVEMLCFLMIQISFSKIVQN